MQLLWLPLSHVFGKVLQVVQFRIGFKTAVDGRVDKLMENLAAIRPTFVAAVPRIFEKVYNKVIGGAKAQGGAKWAAFQWGLSVGKKVSEKKFAGQSIGPLLALQHALGAPLRFGLPSRHRAFRVGLPGAHRAFGVHLHAADRLRNAARQEIAARRDEVAQAGQRHRPALLALRVQQRLRQRDFGQVVLGLVVDDLDFATLAHHVRDFFERDVAGPRSVVHLAVCIAFDDSALAHDPCLAVTPRGREHCAAVEDRPRWLASVSPNDTLRQPIGSPAGPRRRRCRLNRMRAEAPHTTNPLLNSKRGAR